MSIKKTASRAISAAAVVADTLTVEATTAYPILIVIRDEESYLLRER